jgi:pimeloyl-ACP methyl ester carboxylesterase
MNVTATAKPSLVAPQVLDDLRARLGSFRSTALQDVDDWSLGVERSYFDRLLRIWLDDYDWRQVESRVQALPWVLAGAADATVRIVHQRAADPTAVAVVLLHGWPDSVLRFEKVLPNLPDVHVLVPALPGFPFAASTTRSIRSAADMATAIAGAIAELGYDGYVVSAGDVGTDIAESLAAQYPDRVTALHLTDLSHRHALIDPPANLSAEEESYLAAVHRWHATEGAYNQLQSTRPNTLAIALGDSPAGLAAWIVEKLHAWSDNNGDLGTVFSPQDVLDWVTTYWVTGAIGTSFAPYAHRSAPGRIVAPTTLTMFPGDLVNAPRSFAARFLDVQSYTVASRGGHFGAWEYPDAYVDGLRAAIAGRRVPT